MWTPHPVHAYRWMVCPGSTIFSAAADVIMGALARDFHLDLIARTFADQRSAGKVRGCRLQTLIDGGMDRDCLCHGASPLRQPSPASPALDCVIFDRLLGSLALLVVLPGIGLAQESEAAWDAIRPQIFGERARFFPVDRRLEARTTSIAGQRRCRRTSWHCGTSTPAAPPPGAPSGRPPPG